jgi:hypothetical protein
MWRWILIYQKIIKKKYFCCKAKKKPSHFNAERFGGEKVAKYFATIKKRGE